ncbi:hypothetical protein BKA81DRAFT_354280, partial [Phyllosticta paracitricarpa]
MRLASWWLRRLSLSVTLSLSLSRSLSRCHVSNTIHPSIHRPATTFSSPESAPASSTQHPSPITVNPSHPTMPPRHTLVQPAHSSAEAHLRRAPAANVPDDGPKLTSPATPIS